MKYHRSFRNQMKWCKKSGNLLEEKCLLCQKILLLCKEYGGYCMSNKCREEREKIDMENNEEELNNEEEVIIMKAIHIAEKAFRNYLSEIHGIDSAYYSFDLSVRCLASDLLTPLKVISIKDQPN